MEKENILKILKEYVDLNQSIFDSASCETAKSRAEARIQGLEIAIKVVKNWG